MNARPSLYDPAFVKDLFDEMAGTYGLVNLISSFGFTLIWRRQCARAIPIRPGELVCDLMTGMGELVPDLLPRIGDSGTVKAIDISTRMCEQARRHASRVRPGAFEVIEADVLTLDLPAGTADAVVSTFGLKTFSDDQIHTLADRVFRLLRPGGSVSFLEISVPPWFLLRSLYLFYLRRIIPIIGALALGNPDNYRLLGVYTTAFGNCSRACEAFKQAGLDVSMVSYFFGCATGIVGRKPVGSSDGG